MTVRTPCSSILEELLSQIHLINLLCRRIFKRDVTSWDAPEITSVNPNLELEEDKVYPINVARRLLGSSSTMIFTEFLHKTCPSEWNQVGSIIEWPEDTMICEGSSAMTTTTTPITAM